MPGELAQCALGVGHRDRRKRRFAAVGAIDERAGGSGALRMVQESMAVEALAAQRDEQLAALQAARVGRYAAERGAAATCSAAQHGGRFSEAHHPVPRRASAARATAASENGTRLPAIS